MPVNQPPKLQDSRLLALKLEKGKNYDYSMVWDIKQSLLGQDLKVETMDMKIILTANVKIKGSARN